MYSIYIHTQHQQSLHIKHKESKKRIKTRPQTKSLTIIMKITEKKQRRPLRHYMDASRRFLRRARDFYVDSLVSFDSKVGVITCPASNTPRLSKIRRKDDNEERLEEMYRSMCSSVEVDRVGCFRERGSGGYGGGIDRSYSVALGKIGTIDEDEQCDFQETNMFLRTRSHAVARNYDFH